MNRPCPFQPGKTSSYCLRPLTAQTVTPFIFIGQLFNGLNKKTNQCIEVSYTRSGSLFANYIIDGCQNNWATELLANSVAYHLLLADGSLTSYFGEANYNPENLPSHNKTVSSQIQSKEFWFGVIREVIWIGICLTRVHLLSPLAILSTSWRSIQFCDNTCNHECRYIHSVLSNIDQRCNKNQ